MSLADAQALLQVLTLVGLGVAVTMLSRQSRRLRRLERALDEIPDRAPRQDEPRSSASFRPVSGDRLPAGFADVVAPEEPPRTVATDELSRLAGRFIEEKKQEQPPDRPAHDAGH